MISERGHRWAYLLAAMSVTGCASSVRPAGDREYLDPQTAATVTVGAPALVFARERPELAVHARDYLTLVPVDVNRSGAHARYFFGYVWSTIDKRSASSGAAAPAHFELVVDGRRIALETYGGPLREIGLGEPPVPAPSRSARALVAPVSREAQEFVASAAQLRAVAVRDGVSERYELWSR